ncbi:MAG: hypothetical protein ONB46_09415 [candidate division KSB1 bacterium]|nr:hypothetical protein [candidate division KSB1 bacterium]MDZ7366020.1 hypothetical protein [candidate division KSB1 bacterium]MDZ7404137.1 hypothetical protein [candidate division KSB1 bacterium]
MHKIKHANKTVPQNLKELRAYERKQILNSIDKQLMHEPTVKTKHRKPIIGLIPPWEHVEPVWELINGKPVALIVGVGGMTIAVREQR